MSQLEINNNVEIVAEEELKADHEDVVVMINGVETTTTATEDQPLVEYLDSAPVSPEAEVEQEQDSVDEDGENVEDDDDTTND